MKIDVSTKKHPHVFAEIDDEIAHVVLRYRWAATRRRNALYVRAIVDGKDTLLHRFIMRPPGGLCIDHIDGNPLNNRRDNLRICTRSENVRFAAENGVYVRPDATHIHTVKRKLADGSIRTYRYNRRTKERIANEI